jgi:hypothetical protein
VFTLLVKIAALIISRLLYISPKRGILLVEIVEYITLIVDNLLYLLFRGELIKRSIEFCLVIKAIVLTYSPVS